ncbi:MAG: hypothetical protein ACI8TL_001332 [Natronomonas sp.]|jgi:hypothetical protein
MTDSNDTNQGAQSYGDSQREKMIRYFYWGAFALLVLFGVFATIRVYLSIMEIIDIWVAADFKPVFRLLANAAVALIAVLGLSVLVRRFDIPFGESSDN